MTETKLTVWDSPSEPESATGTLYRWSGYAEGEFVHSLLHYIEEHGDRLRRRYLGWVHDLGEYRIDGRRLVERLSFDEGSSYWWMTLFVEQSPWITPSIIDAIRLLALEEIAAESRPSALCLVSANARLNEVLLDFCRRRGIAYEWRRLPAPESRTTLIGVVRGLPQPVQALISFARRLRAKWKLSGAATGQWFSGDRALFFCSYFTHLSPTAGAAGRFQSGQWETLPAAVERDGYACNWFQHYLPSIAVPDVGTALDWVRGFNQDRSNQGFHTFVESFLSPGVALRALGCWVRLVVRSWSLGDVTPGFRPDGSDISFWPLMRNDWYASLRGPVSIDNLLWVELFDRAIRTLPPQRKGVYLYENQAWERALIESWRRYQSAPLIAVAHSTVRFWDLRYFADPRTLQSVETHAKPQPDLVVLNGPAAVNALVESGFPEERLKECESLRYTYLNGMRPRVTATPEQGAPLRVLILGDYEPVDTRKMLRLLTEAAKHIGVPVRFTLKPHPNFAVRIEDHPELELQLVLDPLESILHGFDVAYAGNVTSAAVDAYLAGLPLMVMLDEAELNFSPLRGHAGVRFVATPIDLAAALNASREQPTAVPDRGSFFCLDPELPRWRELLESA